MRAMLLDRRAPWVAGGLLLAGAGLSWLLDPAGFARGWLSAFVLFGAWPLGSMALLLIHALTGGRWGEALRPGLLVGTSGALLLPLLVLPVLACLPLLYAWARPEGAALPNHWWLNPVGFAIRGGIALVLWLGLAVVIGRGGALRGLAPFALPAMAVTVTCAAIDFTMSLDPAFTSSSYGMIAGAGAMLLALAAAIPLSPPAEVETADSVGRLLLALCALWTYLDFMQVVIVWQNDLGTQVPWYLARTGGPWGWVMGAIAALGSVVPILALLAPGVRRSRRLLLGVCGLLIAAAVLRAWWTVLPPRLPGVADLVCLWAVAFVALLWARRAA